MAPLKKDAGVHTPLLPELKLTESQITRSASVSGAVFNVSTTIIGAGIMSIPATLKILGVIPAFFLIVIVALLSDISAEFLMKFTHAGESTTYAGVMKESFGQLGSVAVQICVLICNHGALIICVIIIGDVLSGNETGGTVHLGILQEWFGIHWWNSRDFAVLLVIVFVLLPLVLIRRVESLGFSSAIAVLLAVIFVVICSVMAISALMEGKVESPRLIPQLDDQASFFELFTAIPVIVCAFTFHYNVHSIGFQLGKPSDMTFAVRISLVLCSAIYFTIGIFGYLLFGDSIMADILINFDKNSHTPISLLLNNTIRLSFALHLMLVFPLLNFPLRANIDEFLFPKKPHLATDNARFLSLTVILLAFTYIGATVIPNIWYFFQFVGSTTVLCLAYIFPAAIALRDVHGISTIRDRIVAAVMIILAVITGIITISTNLYDFIGNKS